MTPSSFTCALHATHRRRQPGSMMMIAVRGRSGTGRAGPATGLDQPSSAGATAALHGCGRDMDVMDPASMRLCAADWGAAELYHFEAAERRSLDKNTAQVPGCVLKLSPVRSRAGKGSIACSPTRVTLQMNVLPRRRRRPS